MNDIVTNGRHLARWLNDDACDGDTSVMVGALCDEIERLRAYIELQRTHIQQQSGVILDVIKERDEALRLLKEARESVYYDKEFCDNIVGGPALAGLLARIDAFLAPAPAEQENKP